MRKLLAVCLMFFGTPIMAENITLLCTPKEGTYSMDQYIRFNDEEQTLVTGFKVSHLNLSGAIILHWSDKIIIFASKPSSPTNTSFHESLNVLDRVKGRLQTAYVSHGYFEEETAVLNLKDCELYDREKPKF